jgi:ceramide glucosyltransferase
LLSLALTLWQLGVGLRFPLHRRSGGGAFTPPVTLLKPLKGCDAETAACLESWLRQDYPAEIQVLFGVASPDDPAGAVVRRLLAAHPNRDAQLVVCGESLGPNAKVSTLTQLERLARHDLLVVSDADVWAPPDLLREVVNPLSRPETGLVTCFYRLANTAGLAMRLEALGVNADFWSQVLQARNLKPLDFALGAVMATTRPALAGIGGFQALVDWLADDYQLGHRIAKLGRRIELCPVVVECRSAPATWRDVWSHQVRWARTIRACQPAPYFFSILGNATLWPLLWLASHPTLATATAAGVCLLVRMCGALALAGKMDGISSLTPLVLAPLKDLLQVVVWASAFAGRRVTWRGEQHRVLSGGRLESVN